jgi:hypothetical protein
MNNLSKIAFSKTLEKVEWQNTTLVKEHVVEEVTYSGNPSHYHQENNAKLGEIWNLPEVK